MVRREIESGVFDDADRADQLEGRADDLYGEVVPTDETLADAFRARFAEEPHAFSPA